MDRTKINELRGLACLLVLAFHAIGSEPSLNADAFGYFASSLQFVRMPIFIAITGLLYGLSRGAQPLTWIGWRKRMTRLLPPFVVATFVVCSLDAVRGAGFHPLHALIFGAWHLWYLLALGVILMAVVIIEAAISLESNKLWFAAFLAILAAATGLLGSIQLFGVARAVTLLPFFLAGAAIGAAPKQEVATPLKVLIYAAGFTALILHQLSLQGFGHHWVRGSIVVSALGLAGFMLVGALCPHSRRLRQIGVHSLPVFLWHLPVYAIASGLILHHVTLDPHLAVLLRISLGVVVPIGVARNVEAHAPHLSVWVGARSEKRRRLDEQRERQARLTSPRDGDLTLGDRDETTLRSPAEQHSLPPAIDAERP